MVRADTNQGYSLPWFVSARTSREYKFVDTGEFFKVIRIIIDQRHILFYVLQIEMALFPLYMDEVVR